MATADGASLFLLFFAGAGIQSSAARVFYSVDLPAPPADDEVRGHGHRRTPRTSSVT
jgi:hypothetical protein